MSLPDELLNTTPAYDIRVRIQRVVDLLEKLDFTGLLASRSVLSRLTGADVEARLKFGLAGERVISAIGELRVAAKNAHRIHKALGEAKEQLHIEQHRLDYTITIARQRLGQAENSDDYHLARFERRLSNIMAIHAANTLTIKQIDLAMCILSDLLDRVTDVDTLLLPLWQRNCWRSPTAPVLPRKARRAPSRRPIPLLSNTSNRTPQHHDSVPGRHRRDC